MTATAGENCDVFPAPSVAVNTIGSPGETPRPDALGTVTVNDPGEGGKVSHNWVFPSPLAALSALYTVTSIGYTLAEMVESIE